MGGQVSTAPYRTAVALGIDELGDVIEYTGQTRIGESKEDDMMRRKLKETLTPFELKQQNLNKKLNEMKKGAEKFRRNKHSKVVEGIAQKQQGQQEYKQAKIDVEKKLEELKEQFEKDKDLHIKELNSDGSGKSCTVSVDEMEQRLKTIDLFRTQIDTVETIYGEKRGIDQRLYRSKEEETATMDLDLNELGNLPDLDPQSWENYSKFLEKDQKIDEFFDRIYEVNATMHDIALKIKEAGKKEDVILAQQKKEVKKLLATSKKANEQVNAVTKAVEGKGCGKICVYIVIVCLIIGVAYGIYTAVNGDDPCKEYNNKECTTLSGSTKAPTPSPARL